MKLPKTILALALGLAGLAAAGTALAQHRHHHGPRVSIGIGFGVPYAAFPYYYPYYHPYYGYAPYYSTPIVVQQQPTVYVEQPAPQAQPQQPAGYWYYCNDARAYYPYVKECPGGWQRVAPQPG
jgi:hypothetical protein